ncbi:MAG TPA: RsmD family RNA methyltransferase [Actinomycetota bacterium]|nr:RsmD family RNA methyltransferase [Actinomycetota bacterium]
MRVIAGSAKGTRLAPVPAGTRPLSDRAREGLFSSLGATVAEARVLDLFAGTGAIGIEALSRGSRSATFVESAPAAAKTIRENLRRTRLERAGTIRRGDALRALRQGIGQFDVVLADPPYRLPEVTLDAVMGELAGQSVVAPGGTVALTRPDRGYMPVIPVSFRLERRLSYGDMVVLVFRVS